MSDYLPPNVLTEILTRLPVKSLLRCSSVCKYWNSLIMQPFFIETHLKRQKTRELLLIRTCPENTQKEVFSWHSDDEAFTECGRVSPLDSSYEKFYRIVGSFNGILCLADGHPMYVDDLILWNPSYRKWVNLPLPSRLAHKLRAVYRDAVGFGFDATTSCELKVVRIVYLKRGFKVSPRVYTYTLSSGKWKNISHSAVGFKHLIIGRAPQAFVNGAVHWIVWDDKENPLRYVIVCFHMGDEVFSRIELPTALPFRHFSQVRPAVINNVLSVVEARPGKCRIWMMNEYGDASSWTKKLEKKYRFEARHRLVGFRKQGGYLVRVNEELYSYDPEITEEESGAAKLKKLGIRTKRWESLHAESYVESLVSPGRQTEEYVL